METFFNVNLFQFFQAETFFSNVNLSEFFSPTLETFFQCEFVRTIFF